MDIDIRKAVIANMTGSNDDDVRNTIVDAINMKEEKVLPGLGVLFELLWQHGTPDQQNQIVTSIVQSLK